MNEESRADTSSPKGDEGFDFYDKFQRVFTEKEMEKINKCKSAFEAVTSSTNPSPQLKSNSLRKQLVCYSIDGYRFPQDDNLAMLMVFYALIKLKSPVIDTVFSKFNFKLSDVDGKVIFPRPRGEKCLGKKLKKKM